MRLHDFTPEILLIGKEQDMAIDIAKDMFIANIRNAGETSLPYYAGADEVDYAALKPALTELEDSAQDFLDDYRAKGAEIRALYADGDLEGIRKLMVDCITVDETEAAGE